MKTPALLLLVVLAFIILATAVIIIAALVQKPTRQWRLQWAENTADLKSSGVKTLRGEPVQPRRVSFDELWIAAEMAQSGQGYQRGASNVAGRTAVAGTFASSPVAVAALPKLPKYPPWSPPPEGPPPPTFDELRAADLIGTTNPGASDVSAVPEIPPGQFWTTVGAFAKGLWDQASNLAKTSLTKPDKDAEAGAHKASDLLADAVEPGPAAEPQVSVPPPPAPPEPDELDQPADVPVTFPVELPEEPSVEDSVEVPAELLAPVPLVEPSPQVSEEVSVEQSVEGPEPELRHSYVNWTPTENSEELEDSSSLSSWVGGLKYLQEEPKLDAWRARLPKLSDATSDKEDPNALS